MLIKCEMGAGLKCFVIFHGISQICLFQMRFAWAYIEHYINLTLSTTAK